MAKRGMCGEGGMHGKRGVPHPPLDTTRYSRSMRGRYASHWNAFLFNVCIPVSCGPLVILRIVRRVGNDFTFHCSICLANFQLSDEYDSSGTIHLWHEHIFWICLQHITFHNKNTLGLAQIEHPVKTSRFIADGTQCIKFVTYFLENKGFHQKTLLSGSRQKQ